MHRNAITAAVATFVMPAALGGCGLIKHGEPCLPKDEHATVLRKGIDSGQRYVVLKRANGEEVTCMGKSTPQYVNEGDVIDAATLIRADAMTRDRR